MGAVFLDADISLYYSLLISIKILMEILMEHGRNIALSRQGRRRQGMKAGGLALRMKSAGAA